MRHRIPAEAFEHYRSLGANRSYAAVAAHYGVSVRGVTKRALKEDWRGRLAAIDREAQRQRDEKAVEDIRSIDERHLKMVRAVQARSLEALRTMTMTSAAAAARALDVAVRLERKILGVPEGHSAIDEDQGLTPAQVDAILAAARATDEHREREATRPPAPLPEGRAAAKPGAN